VNFVEVLSKKRKPLSRPLTLKPRTPPKLNKMHSQKARRSLQIFPPWRKSMQNLTSSSMNVFNSLPPKTLTNEQSKLRGSVPQCLLDRAKAAEGLDRFSNPSLEID